MVVSSLVSDAAMVGSTTAEEEVEEVVTAGTPLACVGAVEQMPLTSMPGGAVAPEAGGGGDAAGPPPPPPGSGGDRSTCSMEQFVHSPMPWYTYAVPFTSTVTLEDKNSTSGSQEEE